MIRSCCLSPQRPHRLSWQTFHDGTRHIRVECGTCGTYLNYAPKTPENVKTADAAPAKPAPARQPKLFEV